MTASASLAAGLSEVKAFQTKAGGNLKNQATVVYNNLARFPGGATVWSATKTLIITPPTTAAR